MTKQEEIREETATSTPEILEAKEPATAIISVKPEADQAVIALHEQSLKLKQYAEALIITSDDDIKSATNDLSLISGLKKAIEEKRKEYTQPINDHLKAVNEAFKVFTEPLVIADQTTRHKMLTFDAEQKRIRREQEEINRQKQELAEREAALNGHAVEPVELVEVIPETPKRVSTDMGTAGQRDNWKWEVIDFSQIPDEYKMIDAGVLTPVVKASKGKITIPGVRIFNEPIIAVNVR